MKLEQKWIDYLKSQPESGIGYHKTNVYFTQEDTTKRLTEIIHTLLQL